MIYRVAFKFVEVKFTSCLIFLNNNAIITKKVLIIIELCLKNTLKERSKV